MDRLPDLLRDIRAQLLDAEQQARQEATDSGDDGSPYWAIAHELSIAWDSVDASLEALPKED